MSVEMEVKLIRSPVGAEQHLDFPLRYPLCFAPTGLPKILLQVLQTFRPSGAQPLSLSLSLFDLHKLNPPVTFPAFFRLI